MSENPFVLLSAGGTGGHLFPAEALAGALGARGFAVELATDRRGAVYAATFPARAVHALPAATPSGAGILGKGVAAASILAGTAKAWWLLRRRRPAVIVGFGGYPSVPAVLAGTLLGIPAILHEQNAVMGRANRFLAGRVDAIATGFAELGGLPAGLRAEITPVGNPVRAAVLAAAGTPFSPLAPGDRLRLLVFGGSQGARVMADIVPPALERLPEAARARLAIVQQTREEDIFRVRQAYAELGVAAELSPFFADLPARMAAAHLVIARAGASTLAELTVIGRPAILVPLPGAIDQDQAANAATLAAAGAGTVVAQPEFTPAWLAAALADRLAHPETVTMAAAAARRLGIPDAAERLAGLLEKVAGR